MANTVNNVDPFGDGSGVALWQFDGNANDAGGNYNGTWHGTEQYDTGKFGQAAKFNNSYINTIFQNTTNIYFSYSFWFKSYVADTTLGVLVDDRENSSTYNRSIYVTLDFKNTTNKYLKILIKDGTTTWDNSIPFSPNDNDWHFLCVIYDNDLHTYLDNVLKDETSISTTRILKSGYLYFGKYLYGSSNYYFNGLIDQVRIFNRALTAEEVAILYNEYKPLKSFARSNIF